METHLLCRTPCGAWLPPCYTLSRLKGIETLESTQSIPFLVACYTLSRLKGIETATAPQHKEHHGKLAIHFPVWRESKHTFSVRPLKLCETCYTLSRLKGIETVSSTCFMKLVQCLAIHFPVWRESKLPLISKSCQILVCLAIHFPVWRESKRSAESCAMCVALRRSRLQLSFPRPVPRVLQFLFWCDILFSRMVLLQNGPQCMRYPVFIA